MYEDLELQDSLAGRQLNSFHCTTVTHRHDVGKLSLLKEVHLAPDRHIYTIDIKSLAKTVLQNQQPSMPAKVATAYIS